MDDTSPHRISPWVILDALRHRYRLVLLSALIVPAFAVAAWVSIRPKVKMTALIAVQESMKLNPVYKDMTVSWSMRNELPLVTSILLSRTTLERVLRRLGSLGDSATPDEIDWAVRDFQTKLEVFPEGGDLIRLNFVDRDADRTFEAVKALTETLVDEMTRPQRESLDQSVGFLKEQLTRVETELKDVEEKLKKFKEAAAGDPDARKIMLEARQRLSNELVDTETDLVAAEQRVKLASQRLLRYDPVSKQLRDELDKARDRVGRLQGTYTNIHPQVRAAQADVARLEKDLADRERTRVRLDADNDEKVPNSPEAAAQQKASEEAAAAEIVIRADDVMSGDLLAYQAAASETESLRHKLDLLRKKADAGDAARADFVQHEQELNRLLRAQETKSKVFTSLSEKYEDSLVSRELNRQEQSKMVRVVEKPAGPVTPKKMSLTLVLLVTPILGLLLGAAAALGLEIFDPTLRDPDEVQALAGVPVIGTLPWLP